MYGMIGILSALILFSMVWDICCCSSTNEEEKEEDASKYYSSEDSDIVIDIISDLPLRLLTYLCLPQVKIKIICICIFREKLTNNYSALPGNPWRKKGEKHRLSKKIICIFICLVFPIEFLTGMCQFENHNYHQIPVG